MENLSRICSFMVWEPFAGMKLCVSVRQTPLRPQAFFLGTAKWTEQMNLQRQCTLKRNFHVTKLALPVAITTPAWM